MQTRLSLIQSAQNFSSRFSKEQINEVFKNPVFILSAPRAGSTLLFENLIKASGLWSIGSESHIVFSQFPHLRFENQQLDSASLSESHADELTKKLFKICFLLLLKNHEQSSYLQFFSEFKPITFLEKTPRNALNIPFLLEMYPNAKFIYLYRDPRENIASIVEAWKQGLKTGQFVTFPNLPEWHLPAWCLLLPPKWRTMIGKSLVEIANFQWCQSNKIINDNLMEVSENRWMKISFQNLIDNPSKSLKSMVEFSGLDESAIQLSDTRLKQSKTTLTPAHVDKWKKYETEIMALQPMWQKVLDEISS